jgi:hypothetical protein
MVSRTAAGSVLARDMLGGLELSFDVCSRRTIGEFSLKCKNNIFGTFRVRLLKEGTDDDVEAVAIVLKASLGVSALGGVLKLGWLGSQFFRSRGGGGEDHAGRAMPAICLCHTCGMTLAAGAGDEFPSIVKRPCCAVTGFVAAGLMLLSAPV